ncbi:MAG TPA: hypothetical protein EYP19_01400 [Desulfobacterales bacterium]|nr:hypothetical protein [Desulfobacterales bacterium]
MKRSTAKAGMISSLSGLVISALFRFKGAKALHICSGWALIGFSVWHCLLNQPKSKGRKI